MTCTCEGVRTLPTSSRLGLCPRSPAPLAQLRGKLKRAPCPHGRFQKRCRRQHRSRRQHPHRCRRRRQRLSRLQWPRSPRTSRTGPPSRRSMAGTPRPMQRQFPHRRPRPHRFTTMHCLRPFLRPSSSSRKQRLSLPGRQHLDQPRRPLPAPRRRLQLRLHSSESVRLAGKQS